MDTNLNLDGLNLLRSLDLAAYQSLLERDFFSSHTVLNQAKELTIKLFHLLAPFLPRSPVGRRGSSTDAISNSVGYTEKQSLFFIHCEEWFKAALKLKANLVLSTARFELVAYQPGTLFDPQTMKTDSPRNKSRSKVKLCLFPALFVYPKDQFTSLEDTTSLAFQVSKAIVQTSNFVRTDGGWRDKYKPITKAEVILE